MSLDQRYGTASGMVLFYTKKQSNFFLPRTVKFWQQNHDNMYIIGTYLQTTYRNTEDKLQGTATLRENAILIFTPVSF